MKWPITRFWDLPTNLRISTISPPSQSSPSAPFWHRTPFRSQCKKPTSPPLAEVPARVSAGSYEINGVDTTPSRGVMNLFGVIAPSDTFTSVADTLIASLGSFRFTDEYIQAGIDQTNQLGQNAMEYSQQNMELMDRVTQNFSEYIRQ